MPFTADDAKKHTKKATTAKLRRQWAAVANSTRQKCLDDGGDEKECDARGIRAGNSVIAKEANEMDELSEATTKKVGGRTHDRGDFLVVEDPDQTTTWHLPVKVRGTPNRGLAGGAWAALFSAKGFRGNKYEGPGKTEAKRKLRALYKREGWDEPKSEAEIQDDVNLVERHYSDEVQMWSMATSFSDLEAERETRETVADLRRHTDDLMMMVGNVMWTSEIENKVPALRSLFDEYLIIVGEQLGGGPASEPAEALETDLLESAPVDLAEHAALLSVTEASIDDLAQEDALLAEQRIELTDPRRAPVLVNFSIIQPGHGNQKHKNYYPPETLAEAGPLVEGVDIFVTDHNPDEKGEKTKVGRFRIPGTLAEAGLVSQAIIYDPDQAEKTRNRDDAGELGTMHCSIFAAGLGRPGKRDGQDVTVIEKITAINSIDLVSRHGAGGRALSLAENDGGISMDPETPQDEALTEEGTETPETDVQEVDIVESDETPEAPPDETPAVEEADTPATVEAERIIAILTEAGLDEKARPWLLGRTYQLEDDVTQAIEEMRTFIADMTPAGQPFALGEMTAAEQSGIPKILTPEELEERARQRAERILSEFNMSTAGNL